ncbi:hypothetical protein AB0G77_28305 [Streptomyces hygroscopicus]
MSWLARRRSTIATQILRDACYGTSAVGLAFWWIERWAERH